nr:relaxase/mobilization nuclease domain-containing protein [Trabulsiella odontotermitis]
MQKIRRGKNFAGVVFYALKPAAHHKQTPYVIGGNMMGSSAVDLIDEFNISTGLRPDVVKPMWHNSLRLPRNETLTDSQWSEIADQYMKSMGFSDTHLRCYVLHDDKDGQHIHIIASRISMHDGKLYLGKNENLVSTRIIQVLEKGFDLIRTKGPETPFPPASPSSSKEKRKNSRNEEQMKKRTEENTPKEIIQQAIDEITTARLSSGDFIEVLKTRGITAKANVASTGKMNGFSFEYAGIAFKASQLGKKYSWKNLQELIIYEAAPATTAFSEENLQQNEPLIQSEGLTTPLSIDALHPIITVCSTLSTTSDIQTGDTVTPFEAIYAGGDVEDKKVQTYEKVKEPGHGHFTSWAATAFRWIETIPYINTIIRLLKKLNITFLKRPKKHGKINSMALVEVAPLELRPPIDTQSKPGRTPFSL